MLDALVAKLQQIVGPRGWESDPHVLEANLTEWRGVIHGRTPIMLLPQTTRQVADIVAACAAARVGVVPQGGNTGMCAGAVPDSSGDQILVNLSRLRKIRTVDPLDFSMIAEAGCVLADIQAAARDAELMFPLSHGGEGSCQIGGNVSTNAGGINVLKYGTARDLVLGVEVVLADGTVWDGIKTLRKDTAGYDLKQLFIGSEGTLGIVTAVALKLLPAPGETSTALVACDDVAGAVKLLAMCRRVLADQVLAFELIGARAMELVLQHVDGARLPFDGRNEWYVLIDAITEARHDVMQQTLAGAAEDGLLVDAVIAKNVSESDSLWRMRHSITEAQKRHGDGIKHDVSVPIGKIDKFVDECEQLLRQHVPGVDTIIFGHVGDGNLHYNAFLPTDTADAEQKRLRDTISRIVYDLVTQIGGSISAEHGIGVLKKPFLEHYKSDAELSIMRSLKATLDPHNILNPGKVI